MIRRPARDKTFLGPPHSSGQSSTLWGRKLSGMVSTKRGDEGASEYDNWHPLAPWPKSPRRSEMRVWAFSMRAPFTAGLRGGVGRHAPVTSRAAGAIYARPAYLLWVMVCCCSTIHQVIASLQEIENAWRRYSWREEIMGPLDMLIGTQPGSGQAPGTLTEVTRGGRKLRFRPL